MYVFWHYSLYSTAYKHKHVYTRHLIRAWFYLFEYIKDDSDDHLFSSHPVYFSLIFFPLLFGIIVFINPAATDSERPAKIQTCK